MIERLKAGGLCYVGSKRHSQAQNIHVIDHSIEAVSDVLMYADAHNEYDWPTP